MSRDEMAAIGGTALGLLAVVFFVSGSDPGAANPVAIPAAAPVVQKPKAPEVATATPPTAAPDVVTTTAKAAEPTVPAPKAAEPKAIATPVLEQPKPQPTSPKPAPVPASSTGGDRDCTDFPDHDEAQRFFLANGGPTSDPHKLDRDNDGVACES